MHLNRTLSFPFMGVAGVTLCAILFGAAWLLRDNHEDDPYLRIAGGGFIFNYRISEVFYGFTAMIARPLRTGSIIEAWFEDPSGQKPLVMRRRVGTETDRYTFRSPPVRGVEAGRPYDVLIKVYDRQGETELWRKSKTFTSQISDKMIADKPLTIGPGYARNPKLTQPDK